jgi:alpha-glucosidase
MKSLRIVPLLLCAAQAALAKDVVLESPKTKLRLVVALENGRLTHCETLAGASVVEPSPLGIIVDGTDLGQGATLDGVEHYTTDTRYPWHGVHSEAVDRSNGARLRFRHAASKTTFTIDARVFDDAVAFRVLVPGSGRRVPDAAISFRLPAGSTVWFHGARDHYEGLYARKALADVAADEWAGPPLTFRLPKDAGYASITEAALSGYAGMMLQADGHGGFHERLGHAVPASYPYVLRYGEENAKRLATAAALDGPIATPWRVVLVGPDLNSLVNSDAVHNLAAPPDPRLFPQGLATPWLRSGRAVWRYLDGGESSFEGIKEFSRLAGELGFEHQIVEGQWTKWSDDQIRDLTAYSKEHGVSIWFWIHSRDHRVAEERQKLFARLHDLGVAGIKMDFFDHEAKELIDLYQAVLADAAAAQLLVDFHGANKPTGDERTWPNEMTREGIRGLEYRSTPAFAAHNTTLPFTRFLAGHADYTPLVFGDRRKETTWAHQIATVIVFTSPVMVYGAHPKSLLENPAADVIKSIPSVWDETRVLPPSEIGGVAVFARRSGERWFLGILNGPEALRVRVPLSFLGPGAYRAKLLKDVPEQAAAVAIEERSATATETLEIALPAAGGFVARFTR